MTSGAWGLCADNVELDNWTKSLSNVELELFVCWSSSTGTPKRGNPSWLSTGRCLIDCTFGFCNNRARFVHFSFACMGFSELEAHTADVATPVLGFIQLICMIDLRDFCCDAMWPYGRQHNTRYTAMHRSNAQGRG